MRYLKGTSDFAITFDNLKEDLRLQAWSDVSYEDDLYDRRSTIEYIFRLNDGPISWQSRKQTSVARSTYEAKYMA